jgi:DNA-nicking Smr family endonuclease
LHGRSSRWIRRGSPPSSPNPLPLTISQRPLRRRAQRSGRKSCRRKKRRRSRRSGDGSSSVSRAAVHGFTQREAHAALLRFLHRAQADGVKIALVVTGKGTGKGSDPHERGVLKRQVPMWLTLPEFRSVVVGFQDAHTGHGGEGALYIRLRRAR